MFELGEEAMLLEDGSFEIVHQGDAIDFLLQVRYSSDFLRILPAGIGPGSGDAESRLEKKNGPGPGKVERFDDLPASLAAARRLVEEQREIGADGGGPGGEGFEGDVAFAELVEGEEGVGGVGTPSSESGSMGDGFLESDAIRTGRVGFVLKKADGPADEVAFVGGDTGSGTVKGEDFGLLEGEPVGESGERKDDGLEFVKPVVAPSLDGEREVDLGGRIGGHEGMRPRRARCRPVFPFSRR